MTIQEIKRWFAIGTGVAIEISGDDLEVTVARVRPGGVSVLGSLAIHRFRSQPAAEWGSVYAEFLKKVGQRHLAAQVLLPRDAVIVRQLAMPGVSDKDLGAALRFQVDSLHPYSDEEVLFDYARIRKTPTILIGIARRSVIDEFATLFAEAGIKISAFTFSAANLYAAVRVLAVPPTDGFLAFGEDEGEIEVYGESPARPLFSARLEAPGERALGLALSELRLPPATEPVPLSGMLPAPLAVPEEYDATRSPLAYAAAIAGACPWFALSANLLPPELRKASSRLIYVPTIVLAILVLAMTVAVSAYGSYGDKRYLVQLQRESQKVQPRAHRSGTLDRQIAETRNRAQSLDNFRHHLKDDLNAIDDMSKILPTQAWLSGLQLTRDSISVSGETDRAEALLKLLDGSRQFRRSEFTLPISRTATGEVFSIHSVREGVTP